MLVYECKNEDNDNLLKPWLSHEGFECFTPNMPLSWYGCDTPLVGWAVGSEGTVLFKVLKFMTM